MSDAYSFGCGMQSMGMLVLAVNDELPRAPFLFANVGDDSEHPATLAYLTDWAIPYAKANGVELAVLQRHRKDGSVETLRERLRRGSRAIPARRVKDGPPMSRSCTADFKVAVVGKELKRRGATAENPWRIGIGISVDEIERAKPGIDPRSPWQDRTYPLLDLGFHRSDCARVIADAGLPVPPKSSCFFCPFHDLEAWRKLKRETPALFAEACAIEAELTASASDGRPVFLTRRGVALADAIDDQEPLFTADIGCDSGWCMT